jgi:hypothetical protein
VASKESYAGAIIITEVFYMAAPRSAAIYPTADEINAMPLKFRQYIHDLISRCDKSGDLQTIAILREDRDALLRQVEELRAELQSLRGKQRE